MQTAPLKLGTNPSGSLGPWPHRGEEVDLLFLHVPGASWSTLSAYTGSFVLTVTRSGGGDSGQHQARKKQDSGLLASFLNFPCYKSDSLRA